jgi:hypothetical protein
VAKGVDIEMAPLGHGVRTGRGGTARAAQQIRRLDAAWNVDVAHGATQGPPDPGENPGRLIQGRPIYAGATARAHNPSRRRGRLLRLPAADTRTMQGFPLCGG